MTLVEVDTVAIKPKAVVGARQIETGEGTTAVVRDPISASSVLS